ncbi:MAG: hypothetical protein WAV41_02665 [Microgenomates group bacterium]
MDQKLSPERNEEIAQGGVPWDIGSISAVKADVSDLLGTTPITTDDLFSIMGKGSGVLTL